MSDRYRRCFAALEARQEGAFIPFLVLGDPTLEHSIAAARALVAAGADALELGLPFSDPIADGPVIQAAQARALAGGTSPAACRAAIAALRVDAPTLPIGLLVYANLVTRPGLDRFYRSVAAAGVDSVLVADIPLAESDPFERAALAAGIAPVLIAPPNAEPDRLARIAERGRGYTYLASRAGVTGDDRSDQDRLRQRVSVLRRLGAPPPVIGFGIGSPEQVRAALSTGATGVVVGSALVRRFGDGKPGAFDRALGFARELKAATRTAISN